MVVSDNITSGAALFLSKEENVFNAAITRARAHLNKLVENNIKVIPQYQTCGHSLDFAIFLRLLMK